MSYILCVVKVCMSNSQRVASLPLGTKRKVTFSQWFLTLVEVPNPPVPYAHSPNPTAVKNKIYFSF